MTKALSKRKPRSTLPTTNEATKLIAKLTGMLDVHPTDFIQWDEDGTTKLTHSDDLTHEQKAAIREVKLNSEGRVVAIRLHDKQHIIALLLKNQAAEAAAAPEKLPQINITVNNSADPDHATTTIDHQQQPKEFH